MLADMLGDSFKLKRSQGYSCCRTGDLTIIKPLSFMNRSGMAVRAAMEYFDFSPEDILVACDDFNLPPGKLRLRGGGSAGGHNGLQSIIDSLGTNEFSRIRMGIGGQDIPDKSAFVLKRFKSAEKKIIKEMLIDAVNLVNFYCEYGLEKTMNRFN